jgi:5-hydroxyisourate hydrolase-like protein (transthyretin family)
VATSQTFTANDTAGKYTVTATGAALTTKPGFALTNKSGPPASIAASAGTPQTATVNTAFATQLAATVKDTFGNPVAGATVTFTAPGSGASGTFAGGVNTATTNAAGVATAPVFAANTTAGGYTVTAKVGSFTTSPGFALTNAAGAPAAIAATAGTPQTATVNTAFATAMAAMVTDGFGNPVSGATVTFNAPGSGASGTFAGGVNTATTNSLGVATAAAFTANTTAGSYTVTATAGTVTTNPGFALTNQAGAPASIAATGGTPQSATIDTAFAKRLTATVKDSFGNPVAGATVTFNAPSSGASGTFAGGVNTAKTSAAGVATAAVFTANGTAGSYTVTAKVGTVTTSPGFALTNKAAN